MGLSWQEYWSGLPFSPPGYLPDPETELELSLHWQADSLPLEQPRKPLRSGRRGLIDVDADVLSRDVLAYWISKYLGEDGSLIDKQERGK